MKEIPSFPKEMQAQWEQKETGMNLRSSIEHSMKCEECNQFEKRQERMGESFVITLSECTSMCSVTERIYWKPIENDSLPLLFLSYYAPVPEHDHCERLVCSSYLNNKHKTCAKSGFEIPWVRPDEEWNASPQDNENIAFSRERDSPDHTIFYLERLYWEQSESGSPSLFLSHYGSHNRSFYESTITGQPEVTRERKTCTMKSPRRTEEDEILLFIPAKNADMLSSNHLCDGLITHCKCMENEPNNIKKCLLDGNESNTIIIFVTRKSNVYRLKE